MEEEQNLFKEGYEKNPLKFLPYTHILNNTKTHWLHSLLNKARCFSLCVEIKLTFQNTHTLLFISSFIFITSVNFIVHYKHTGNNSFFCGLSNEFSKPCIHSLPLSNYHTHAYSLYYGISYGQDYIPFVVVLW